MLDYLLLFRNTCKKGLSLWGWSRITQAGCHNGGRHEQVGLVQGHGHGEMSGERCPKVGSGALWGCRVSTFSFPSGFCVAETTLSSFV